MLTIAEHSHSDLNRNQLVVYVNFLAVSDRKVRRSLSLIEKKDTIFLFFPLTSFFS